MEPESVLQSLMVHTSSLELQITQQVLQFQSGTDWSWAPQDHHAKFTLNLNNSALSSTVKLISVLKSLVSNAFVNKYRMKHTPNDFSSYKL